MSLNKTQKIKLKQNYPIILSITKFTTLSTIEIMMAFMGFKPAMAETVFYTTELKNNLNKISEQARQLGLYLAISKYKYIINSPRGIFEEIPLTSKKRAKIILALAKNKTKAQAGADYYHKKMLDSKYGYKFGKLMGYPECCLKFGNYLNNNNNDPNNFGYKNPAIESLKRSTHFAWQLNVFSVSFLSHFPCSLTCQKSIDYVNKIFECLVVVNPDLARYFKKELTETTSLYWSCVDKILLYGDFKQYTLGFGEIRYNAIDVRIDSDSYYQKVDSNKINEMKKVATILAQGNKLIVDDKNLTIYYNKNKIFQYEKDHKYIPVLVKPDILPI